LTDRQTDRQNSHL